jgi:hypothetical protein
MAGVSSRSLGTDDAGREYWRFPSSEDLFIRDNDGGPAVIDEDETAFKKMLAEAIHNKSPRYGGDGEDDDDGNEDDDGHRHGNARMDVEEDNSHDHHHHHHPNAKNEEGRQHIDNNKDSAIKQHGVSYTKPSSKKGWKRVSDVAQIRRIVDLLGDSDKELQLRKNMVTSLLSDRKPDVVAAQLNASTSATEVASSSAVAGAGTGTDVAAAVPSSSSSSSIAKSVSTSQLATTVAATADAATAAATAASTNVTDQQQQGGAAADDSSSTKIDDGSGNSSSTASGRAIVKKPIPTAPDNTPFELRLIRAKGQEVPRKFVINQECVFDEDEEGAEDEDNGQSHKAYFTFGKGR